MILNGSEYQNTLLILSIKLTYTLTPKLWIHRKYTGMTRTLCTMFFLVHVLVKMSERVARKSINAFFLFGFRVSDLNSCRPKMPITSFLLATCQLVSLLPTEMRSHSLFL